METLPWSRGGMSPEDLKKEVREKIRGLLSNLLYPHERSLGERRRVFRCPLPQPIYLTLPNQDETGCQGELIAAAGKDLSELGIGFFHATPLPAQRMVVSLQLSESRWQAFLVKVVCSRAIRQGWYESGARFVRCVPNLPIELTTPPNKSA